MGLPFYRQRNESHGGCVTGAQSQSQRSRNRDSNLSSPYLSIWVAQPLHHFISIINITLYVIWILFLLVFLFPVIISFGPHTSPIREGRSHGHRRPGPWGSQDLMGSASSTPGHPISSTNILGNESLSVSNTSSCLSSTSLQGKCAHTTHTQGTLFWMHFYKLYIIIM